MSAKPTLAILTHALDDFWRRQYLVKQMIPRWEAMGVCVVVVTDPDAFVPADAGLLHVDLSVVPDACRRLVERYPIVINGNVLDIRKRQVSRHLVERDGPDPGMVIVKTDCNYGGVHDFRRQILESPAAVALRRVHLDRRLHRALSWIEEKRSWRRRRLLRTDDYRVFSDRHQVPSGVWRNSNLVVERFRSEREGDYYCCRHWLFFGRREVSRRTLSLRPIVKASDRLEQLPVSVPTELRAIRERLGFEYGKFDYGVVDGELILYDANRTPGLSADPSRHAATIEALSEGILDFLGPAGSGT